MLNYEQFIHFLDGFLADKDRALTAEETKLINDKLNSCFINVTSTPLNYPNTIDWPHNASELIPICSSNSLDQKELSKGFITC